MKPLLFSFVLALSICFGGTIGYAQENGNQTPTTIVITTNDPFSGAPDTYTIYFTLEDNTSYIGRFEIL